MTAFDFEEQERIESFKAWWKDNGTYVYVILAAVIISAIGVTAWKEYKSTRADKTAEAYETFRKVAEKNDAKNTVVAAEKIKSEYPTSLHASQATLLAVKQSVDAKDLAGAEKNLKWVVEKSPSVQIQNIARMRLSAVLLDQKKYDEALKVLDGNKDNAFAASVAELKGDVYFAQGKLSEAKANYKLAVEKADANSPVKQLVQIKLDMVGDEK